MTQIMLRKLISARHKCSVHHACGLVQTGFAETTASRTAPVSELADKWDEQVLRIGETIAYEKDDAGPHRGSSMQRLQGRVDDRHRSWDVWSHYCTLTEYGEVVDRGRFRTSPSGVEKWFTDLPRVRIAMEAGTNSIWVSQQLQEQGPEVIVANVRELRAISDSDRKSDQVDAEKLARYARLDPKILRPISHRTVAQQEALTLIRARNLVVRLRTAAVNAVRGLAKPCGYRLPASSTLCFAKRSIAVLPPGLAQALGPVLEQIAEMTKKIKHYNRLIKQLTETEYPETQALIQVYGVGQLTALTYVLTLGNKERSSEVVMSDAIWVFGRNAASPGIATLSSALPRLATFICVLCWSSAPTTSSARAEKTRPCDGGVSIWHRAEASRLGTGPSLLSHVSLPYCSIASGVTQELYIRSMQ
jgi:transposase